MKITACKKQRIVEKSPLDETSGSNLVQTGRYIGLSRAFWSSVLNISSERGFTISLGDLFQCLRLFFLYPHGISLNQLVPLATCVVTVHPGE